MRVTTLRFGRDLWRLLESEAALAGTSVSQYIREAALARAAAAASARGEGVFDLLGKAALTASAGSGRTEEAVAARTRAAATRRSTEAVLAQSEQARHEASKRTQRAARLAARSQRDGGSR